MKEKIVKPTWETTPKDIEKFYKCNKVEVQAITAIFTDTITLYPIWVILENPEWVIANAKETIANNRLIQQMEKQKQEGNGN